LSDKSIKPRTLIPSDATPIGDVVMGVTLVEIDDLVGIKRHKIILTRFSTSGHGSTHPALPQASEELKKYLK
jgi:hypothetical protein